MLRARQAHVAEHPVEMVLLESVEPPLHVGILALHLSHRGPQYLSVPQLARDGLMPMHEVEVGKALLQRHAPNSHAAGSASGIGGGSASRRFAAFSVICSAYCNWSLSFVRPPLLMRRSRQG